MKISSSVAIGGASFILLRHLIMVYKSEVPCFVFLLVLIGYLNTVALMLVLFLAKIPDAVRPGELPATFYHSVRGDLIKSFVLNAMAIGLFWILR
jgi:hypothetical protein